MNQRQKRMMARLGITEADFTGKGDPHERIEVDESALLELADMIATQEEALCELAEMIGGMSNG